MKAIFKLKTFWLITILASVVIYVALVNLNRSFKSETTLLVIPKSDLSSANGSQIVENLQVVGESLFLYEKLEENRSDLVEEAVLELPKNKKQDFWRKKIIFERVENSGMLVISATDKSRYIAESLSLEASREMISLVPLYYDIKKDLDIRIIDEPITSQAISQSAFILSLESIVSGFFLALVSFVFSFYFFSVKEKFPKTSFDLSTWRTKNSLEKSAEIPIFKTEEVWMPQQKISLEKESVDRTRTASAPDNLPVAPLPVVEKKALQTQAEKQPIIREATPEEVKERLNKLLSGKL